MSEIKNGALDQYGAEPFEQQQFGTAGVEGVNVCSNAHKSQYCVTLKLKNNENKLEQNPLPVMCLIPQILEN